MKEEPMKKDQLEVRVTRRAALSYLSGALTLGLVGCKSLNDDPNNTRFWFPTLLPPTKEERDARASQFPDGGDPYLDAEVGPRSLNTRPRGWADSRSRTSNSFGVVPDVEED